MSHNMHDKAVDALFAYEEELKAWRVDVQTPNKVLVTRYGSIMDEPAPGDTVYNQTVEQEWLDPDNYILFVKLKAMSAALRAVGVEE